MRRPCFRKPALTVTMFPFLAVLVCTMGALIVLLVNVVQKAKFEVQVESAQRAEQGKSPEPADDTLKTQKEVHQWRTQVLEKQREELQKQIGDRRLALSHLEDHIRRLESRWRELTVQAKELVQLGQSNEQLSVASAEQIQNLRTEIDKAKKELNEAKEKAAAKPPTFAIVPYEGPNGTKRRPIYIECTDQGIVLQPNGIILRADDFEGSMGPGNPLDAALRTTREYLARHGDTAIHGEPYPLLIVRPNGTIAYAVARAAIKSWDDEFGYELIDAEMQLAYAPPDPTLNAEVERAIADARSRQAILAAAMPGRFKRGGSSGLVASSNGGFRAAAGEFDEPAPGHVSYAGGGGGGFSNAFRPTGAVAAGGGTAMPAQGQRSGSGSPATGQRPGTGLHASTNQRTGNGLAPAGAQQSPTGSGAAGTPGAHPGAPSTGGSGQSLNVPQPATSPGSSTVQFTGRKGKTNGSGSGGGGGKGGGKGPTDSKPIAASRGENWGLPNRSPTATGFTRYVQVQCLPDRLLVMPEKGDYQGPAVVEMPEDTRSAIDPFVAAIWKRMESWGIAAESGYWKPIVRVQVAPGADDRFQELQTLMSGSGFVIERK